MTKRYQQLLSEIDSWFGMMGRNYPEQIHCRSGCSACCSGLFDISLLEAALLQEGFNRLPAVWQQVVRGRAEAIVERVRVQMPGFGERLTINHRPETDWQRPEERDTPCPFLDDEGSCLVYEYRPSTCRLHGLPIIDLSGEIFQEEYCTDNFCDRDPLKEEGLRHPFRDIFLREIELYKEFSIDLMGKVDLENDTYIPAAIFIDLEKFVPE